MNERVSNVITSHLITFKNSQQIKFKTYYYCIHTSHGWQRKEEFYFVNGFVDILFK